MYANVPKQCKPELDVKVQQKPGKDELQGTPVNKTPIPKSKCRRAYQIAIDAKEIRPTGCSEVQGQGEDLMLIKSRRSKA